MYTTALAAKLRGGVGGGADARSRFSQRLALLDASHPAFTRLIVEEMYTQILTLKKHREASIEENANALSATTDLIKRFIKSLPFELTEAQKKAYVQIQADITSNSRFDQLSQREVDDETA